MKIQIKSIYGLLLFEGDFTSLKEAVLEAFKKHTNLRDADLRGADLRDANLCDANLRGVDLCDANLRGADLRDTNLRGANLCGADLRGADLRDANLRGADLCGADLRDTNLRGADLRGANLCDADLRDANLCGADLRGANLRDTNLRGANLQPVKTDFFDVLLHAKNEVAGLRLAIIEGRIDGSSYEGECACLVGTIANVACKTYTQLEKLKPDSSRPAERLFLAIKKGDKPETNPISKIVLGWTDEFIELIK